MKWHFDVKRQTYLLDVSLIAHSNYKELANLISKGYSRTFFLVENEEASQYNPEEEINEQVAWLRQDWTRTKGILAGLDSKTEILNAALEGLIKEVAQGNLSVDSFEKFFSHYRHFVAMRVPTRIIGYDNTWPAEFLNHIAELRLKFKNNWEKVRQNLLQVWDLVAKYHGISQENIKLLTYREFLTCLNKGIFDVDITGREKTVLYREGDKEYIYTGNDLENFIKENIRQQTDDQDGGMVKGVVACQGKARGKVRVIFKTKGVECAEPYILVTSMTVPNFIPLLKNAQAIITDEGGLTCHAAIISRELKIPCIIGTGNATRVFKDGDLVEVDAEKGIVRKV